MSEPTGKLKFAYDSIANLEQRSLVDKDFILQYQEEVKQLRKALREVGAYLRNDRFSTRVKNALMVIDEVLDHK